MTSDFRSYDKALKQAGIAEPVILLDKQVLQQNINEIERLCGADQSYRIVAKSLPSAELLAVMDASFSNSGFMVFSRLMLDELLPLYPDKDMLMGKPLPVASVKAVLQAFPKAAETVQWLVDTNERLLALETLAAEIGLQLRVSLEIDVGLHRGGFTDATALEDAMRKIAQSSSLTFAGIMGYEAHLSKLPTLFGWRARAVRRAMQAYDQARELAASVFGPDILDTAFFNIGGSTTFWKYPDRTRANDVSLGSVFVLPSDFVAPDLSALKPAFFIATPGLKHLKNNPLPGFEWADRFFGWAMPARTSVYVDGGYWMADPVYPKGLGYSKIFGRSTNQELLAGSTTDNLGMDDFVFFHPHQSEAVIAYLGRIAVFDDGRITDIWDTIR